jgi:CheY-like chemotaxis protein
MTGRLLCVTDEPNARQTLFASLQDCGYEVDVATNYRNALALVERSPYDAALLDEEIKQESGIEIFQAIDRSQGAGLDGIFVLPESDGGTCTFRHLCWHEPCHRQAGFRTGGDRANQRGLARVSRACRGRTLE